MTKREDLHLAIGSESPVVEARGLHRLLSTGHTVEGLCALIAVPPKLERVPTAYAQANTKDACWIEAAMKFRQAVAREFERLVSSNAPVMDLPEAEEVEVFSVTKKGEAGVEKRRPSPKSRKEYANEQYVRS